MRDRIEYRNNSGNWPLDEANLLKEQDMTSHGLRRPEDCSAPRLIGVSRAADNDRVYTMAFDRRLTDAELADIHDALHDMMQVRKQIFDTARGTLTVQQKQDLINRGPATKDQVF